jgi:hypothetical protein
LPPPSPRTTCGLAARARRPAARPHRGPGAGARPWHPRCGLGRSGVAWPSPLRSLGAASYAVRGLARHGPCAHTPASPTRPLPRHGPMPAAGSSGVARGLLAWRDPPRRVVPRAWPGVVCRLPDAACGWRAHVPTRLARWSATQPRRGCLRSHATCPGAAACVTLRSMPWLSLCVVLAQRRTSSSRETRPINTSCPKPVCVEPISHRGENVVYPSPSTHARSPSSPSWCVLVACRSLHVVACDTQVVRALSRTSFSCVSRGVRTYHALPARDIRSFAHNHS